MENPTQETGPLTVVVTWHVRKGREREFEAWRHEIAAAALKFPGHMGVNVIRPSGTEREYVVIFRFDTYEHLRAWQESVIRRELLRKAEPFRENAPSYRLESGLEYWFTPPGVPTSPPRWKMALITVVGVWPASMLVPWLLTPLIRTTFSLARTPDSGRHSYSAHVGDYAVTGENSETLAVIAYQGGNQYERTWTDSV